MGRDCDCCASWDFRGTCKISVQNPYQVQNCEQRQLAKLRDAISTMRTDLDEIKTDLRTVVIQMDDLEQYKVESSIVDEKG